MWVSSPVETLARFWSIELDDLLLYEGTDGDDVSERMIRHLCERCASMFVCCARVLHWLELAAYHRIAAARLARRCCGDRETERTGRLA